MPVARVLIARAFDFQRFRAEEAARLF